MIVIYNVHNNQDTTNKTGGVSCITRHHALNPGRVETESDGTRRRTVGEVKGKEANGVGSQQLSA